MSLSIVGVVRIAEEPTLNSLEQGGTFFNFTAEGKDPKKQGGRYYYKVGVYVPEGKVDQAKGELVKGKSLFIRHGDLTGSKSEKDANYVYNKVNTTWWDITGLIQTMHGDVQ